MKKKLPASIVLFTFILLLTACGKKTTSTPVGSKDTPSTSSISDIYVEPEYNEDIPLEEESMEDVAEEGDYFCQEICDYLYEMSYGTMTMGRDGVATYNDGSTLYIERHQDLLDLEEVETELENDNPYITSYKNTRYYYGFDVSTEYHTNEEYTQTFTTTLDKAEAFMQNYLDPYGNQYEKFHREDYEDLSKMTLKEAQDFLGCEGRYNRILKATIVNSETDNRDVTLEPTLCLWITVLNDTKASGSDSSMQIYVNTSTGRVYGARLKY